MGAVDEDYLKEIEIARRELRSFIANNKCAPLMLQLAWNDAATYDARSRTGGPNASIRFITKHAAIKELEKAVQNCDIVKHRLKLRKVSYADLYQLAGVVAIEVTQGPIIEFVPGRKDSNESPRVQANFLNGEEDARSLRRKFSRMGLSEDKDIVVLCGGHALIRTMHPKVAMRETPKGETHEDRSRFEERKWTKEPLKFDNSYFKELLSKGASFSRLPMDSALVEDQRFYHYVERYAKDEDIFFKEYAISHKKLSELGFDPKNLNKSKGLYQKLNQHRGLVGIGIISVAVAGILVYLHKMKKNQLKD
ncbi:L-ascorbate peroxidase 3 [Vigna radiata var. radiata]|uniref:L-ascorbate peroxidase 3 n=1 Tax=Vigna radiata var. radiata TaxID=3916 RepID=A0A1S3VNI8_VIGRR|nr:L-ascorbate peroxidase 3 [Vigna radiata var. radiata]